MISREDVEHVARLARLALTSEEIERMRTQLNAILVPIDALKAVNTDGVEGTSQAVPLVNVMRDDEPRAPFPAEAMLGNAPDRAGEFFRVPRIIED